jgi:hypothetical protein
MTKKTTLAAVASVLLVVAGTATAVLTAPDASNAAPVVRTAVQTTPAPEPTVKPILSNVREDVVYLTALRATGSDYFMMMPEWLLIETGHSSCDLFASTDDFSFAVDQLMALSFDPVATAQMSGSAVAAYCPQFMPALEQYAAAN